MIQCSVRYQSDHKARTHKRILKNAARHVRAKGLDGAGVASLMKASGLTVGGFYKHFESRDDLLAQAVEEGFNEFGEDLFASMKQASQGQQWKEIVRWYLSLEHCEHADTGCPMVALAPEIARAAPPVRKRILSLMKERRDRLLEFMPGLDSVEKERSFYVIFAAMAGAVTFARMIPNRAEKQKVLDSVRDHLLESF
jgi:TetR/AcrR family transcriptional repressor of nem operon